MTICFTSRTSNHRFAGAFQPEGSKMRRPSRLSLTSGVISLLLALAASPLFAGAPPSIVPGAKLETVYADACFFEGPTWEPRTASLYFTAFGKEKADTKILRLDEAGKVSVWLDNTEGVNGTYLARNGRLLAAQAFGHRVMSYTTGTNNPAQEVLLHDPALNQPNDLCEAPNGDLYFSDPDFGHRTNSAIFLLRPGQPARKVVTDMPLPNGVEVSLDGHFLVVGDSFQKLWRSYPIQADGSVGVGREFFNPQVENRSDPDGLCVDERGNFYLAGRGGVWVVSPAGTELGFVPVAEFVSNVCFGGRDGRTLFLTCKGKLYRLATTVRGAESIRAK